MSLVSALLSLAYAADADLDARARELAAARKPVTLTIEVYPRYLDKSATPEATLLLGRALYDLELYVVARRILTEAGDNETVAKIERYLDLRPEAALEAWGGCRVRRGDRALQPTRDRFAQEREHIHEQTNERWLDVVAPGLLRVLDEAEQTWQAAIIQLRAATTANCGGRIRPLELASPPR